MSDHSYDSRKWRAYLAELKATRPTCYICGHPGATTGHHRLSTSLFPDLAGDPANWVPAHGCRQHERCSTCGMACNQVQGNKLQSVKPPVTSRRW